jgi:probable HAF family extracellular repeat protein
MKNEIRVQSFGSGGVMNRPQVWKAVGLTLLACCLQLYGQQKATITTFDAPGAGTGQYQGTFATTINPAGVIAGYYLDANNVYHGFVRSRGGSFTSFDAPGAGNTPNAYPIQGTQATSINSTGTIVGYYTDSSGNFVSHCFLWAPNGTITNIDPPGSLGSSNQGPIVINEAGAVAGNYTSPIDYGTHGFLRTPGGTFIFPFDPPSYNGTIPTGINSIGAITGFCNGIIGFLRNPDGTFAVFAPSGNTNATGINNGGEIIGYLEYNIYYGPPYGFLRTAKGVINSNVFPGSGANVFPYAINSAGTITGNYFNTTPPSLGQYSGFVLTANGIFTSFDPPGSTNTTAPTAINPAGEITGYYPDANFVYHGFLRGP